METHIIKRVVKTNGKFETLFHQKLEVSKNKEAMNVYVEHLSSKKKDAMVFYSKREVDAMAKYLSTSLEGSAGDKSEVITIPAK